MGTSKYNLEQLGWFNFEQLVCTLLRQIIGNGLSTFSGSVDQGRDATFSGEATSYPSESDRWMGEWIFQVKHRAYSTRGASAVRAELKRTIPDELECIQRKYNHNCQNYVVITNCPFTAKDKDELKSLISSAISDLHHVAIIDESDFQQLLDRHPKVVSAFPMILGISQLRELVDWGLHQRSLEYLQAAQAEVAKFVATKPYLDAIKLLQDQHFCVLSGPPKMGKTCTAYALAASFAALSYEVYDLRNQKDYYNAYKSDVKQLFICDDVFGDISLHASQRDDWTRGFLQLLGSLGRSHKLVWTARGYILKEALTSSKLEEDRPALATTDNVTVAVDQLSRLEKAMILYNHAREANLPPNVREYLQSEACITITDHPNYSPESIRQLCTGRLASFSSENDGDSTAMATKIDTFLSEPGVAWKNAYLAAPAGERLLCTEVMAAGGSILEAQLQKRYENAIRDTPGSHQSFRSSMDSVNGTFLRQRNFSFGGLVQFYHPSMRDLLAELIQSDKSIRAAYLRQLALKELPAIARPVREAIFGGSEEHRIVITDQEDIELLRDHIVDTLLPKAELADALSVATFLHLEVTQGEATPHARSSRVSGGFGDSFWMILDSLIPHLCSKQFWQHNLDVSSITQWRTLFEKFRVLLPFASTAITPEYVPELLRRLKVADSVDYWGLASAAHGIVPTVVEQCEDMGEREVCRAHLASIVAEAMEESESLNLRNFSDSQSWHDEYSSLPEDCDDFAKLFPDDPEIPAVHELSEVIEDYPRLDYEPDEEHDISAPLQSTSSSDAEIKQIFRDL